MTFIEGVFPRPVLGDMRKPQEIAEPRGSQGSIVRPDHAQPQNHSSRDRGIHPQVNPTARTRRGNRR